MTYRDSMEIIEKGREILRLRTALQAAHDELAAWIPSVSSERLRAQIEVELRGGIPGASPLPALMCSGCSHERHTPGYCVMHDCGCGS